MIAANPPGLGPFTAGPDKQIYFAPGNLQYKASTDTWRFAPHQYDMIGYDNINISQTYSGWIDMFGWGTGDNPTQNSQSMDDYEYFVDWGINAIDTFPVNTWRTPTRGEWNYIFKSRPDAYQLWSCATIRTTASNVIGVIILPDNWLTNGPFVPFVPCRLGWSTNVYDLNTWTLMENAGAVFFPAAGFREEIPYTMIKEPNDKGYYWTSTPSTELYNGPLYNGTSQLYNGITQAYDLFFCSDIVDPDWSSLRYRGRSVRLVYVEPILECAVTDTLFIEDFGGNNPADPAISHRANANIGRAYHQVISEADLMCGYDNNFQKTYLLTKVGKHAAGWHLQDDHTYWGDTTRGYFMLVDDGSCAGEPLYTSPVVTVTPGETINYSACFANVKTWFGSAGNTGLTIPSFTLRLYAADEGVMLDSYFTGDIPYDNNQPLESDYRNPSPWIKATAEFEIPLDTRRVKLTITPTATANRWGNDYAIDDICITRCVEYTDTVIDIPDIVDPVIEECDSLIVNELNWIICCNNRLLRSHYPADTYEYQWYKNDVAVFSKYPDRVDYYTEDRQLSGSFYLKVKVGKKLSNGAMSYRYVRSNTIEIAAPQQTMMWPNPAEAGENTFISSAGEFSYRVFTPAGIQVASGEAETEAMLPPLSRGLYLVEIMCGNDVSTLKLLIR